MDVRLEDIKVHVLIDISATLFYYIPKCFMLDIWIGGATNVFQVFILTCKILIMGKF